MRAADVSVWRSRALLMGQVTTVLCGLAAVWLLGEVLLDAGRPASVRVAFRPVTNWPEIKRGGPPSSIPSSADELAGSSASEHTGKLEKRTTIDNNVQPPAELPRLRLAYENAFAGGAESMQSLTPPASSSDHQVQPRVPVVVSPDPSRAEAPPEPHANVNSNVGSAAPVVTPVAPLVPPAGLGPEAPTRPREKGAVGDPQRRANAQQVQSRGQQSLSARSFPPGEAPGIERRTQRRPSAQPTRIAAAQEQVLLAPPEPRGTQEAVADKNRMRILGIPVPTGSEFKQCLLEFRC
jgi:hypothetical protein